MRKPEPDVLELLGRRRSLFAEDLQTHAAQLDEAVRQGSFLVIGGAGSIGRAMVKQIFERSPSLLHVVDISENNLVELVRDIRSSLGYIEGEFRTLPLDSGSVEFDAFVRNHTYDYVVNLSALKHVRSEKDPYSLMRMARVNVLNSERTLRMARECGARKYFCVSTDKAANPVNMMGASKRIMEKFMIRGSLEVPVSLARFANVAFSDGSLLDGFRHRIRKRQPLSAPRDICRYFMTTEESGLLCLLSCVLAENRDIFFPKEMALGRALSFSELAVRWLDALDFEAVECDSEDEARERVSELVPQGQWPCYFFDSDTTGEKPLEEFHTDREKLDLARFRGIGVIQHDASFDAAALVRFEEGIGSFLSSGTWTKEDLIKLFLEVVPEFDHQETFKYLDDRM